MADSAAVPAADPPFVKYAAKFVAALAAAVVGAGAVILAAVDDEHVTVSEWVAIVLAVLAGVGGPAAVFKVRNALTRQQVRQVVASVPTTLDASATAAAAPIPTDGSAAAQRAYPHPPPTQRGAASNPWTPPDGS